MPWDPQRYLQFKDQRYEPFYDLAQLIHLRPGLSVVDLGCGPGELTARLADMLPDSRLLGIDSSAEMLEQSGAFAGDRVRFEQRAIEEVEGEWDVVFSNAALQWVDHHASLLPRLFGMVRPGGQLLVQVPSNFRFVAHTTIEDVAGEEPFHTALEGWVRVWPVLTNVEYAEILYDMGGAEITVYEKVYAHVLEDADAIADWLAGTALVPYMARLPEELREPFMERYRVLLRERRPGNPVLFPFPRILMAAAKPA